MKLLLSLLILAPLLVYAQGIHFENGLSWEQIRGKAKAQNKYVFVDCYASWCGPCKKMDQDVYLKDSVGVVVNDKFISVKVQLDTSKNDNEAVKARYADAHALMAAYKISAFPTYLFFSPAGELVHRGLGYQQPKDFVQLAVEAADPQKQYYVLVAGYRSGARNYAIMPALANRAKTFNENALADSIATDYLHGYLDKLSDSQICTRPNLEFIAGFARVLASKDQVFKCILEYPKLVETAMHDENFARRFVNYIVTKEEINPMVMQAKAAGKEPDWESIIGIIRDRFGSTYVQENVLKAKAMWYKSAKDWKAYTKYLALEMDQLKAWNLPKNMGNMILLNYNAWEIFLYSDDKDQLEKAIAWSDLAIEMEPKPSGVIQDTKANLLYKLGEKAQAIELEKKAVEFAPGNKDFRDALEKMQHGEPTWVIAQ